MGEECRVCCTAGEALVRQVGYSDANTGCDFFVWREDGTSLLGDPLRWNRSPLTVHDGYTALDVDTVRLMLGSVLAASDQRDLVLGFSESRE
jgi:hypothetical protein